MIILSVGEVNAPVAAMCATSARGRRRSGHGRRWGEHHARTELADGIGREGRATSIEVCARN
jgi:hypothetical protein